MTISDNGITFSRAMAVRTLTGAFIALACISLFVLGVDNPDPSWHHTWWVRPIVITPLAGAAGGAFFHFMYELGKAGTWKKIVLSLVGIIGYIIATWMGLVLGLAGTMWN
jgi:hypothetical protein